MKIELTTNHPASSYGVPVAVIDGEAYGAADIVCGAGISAAAIVADWAAQPERSTDERMSAHRFCRQWPEGPQVRNPLAAAMGAMSSPAKARGAQAAAKKRWANKKNVDAKKTKA